MKMRRSIIWFVAAVAFVIALVLWHGPRRSGPPALSPGTPTRDGPTATVSPLRASNVSQNAVSLLPASHNKETVAPQNKKEQMQMGLAEMNDVPIVFYGKLEDQLGNPVVDAQIAASVRIYNGLQSTVDRFSVSSGAEGLFTINHGKGESLSIVPNKFGYVLATENTLFKYSYMYADHFTVNPNEPTVIKMWKLQGADPLINITKEYRLAFTSTPIFLNLISGQTVPFGGDLEALIVRSSGSISKKTPADWSIELKPVNGGIMQKDYHTAQITFEAPTEGYQESYSVQMNKRDPAWSENIHEVFFLKSRGGQIYSKFSLDFGINGEPNGSLYLKIKGVANTNSSRNWEATVPQ
jgi:hypothetical protein